MKYEITENQIKEAHNSACKEWKTKIESWFPECFKQKIEVGKWYKDGASLVFINKYLNNSGIIGYGFTGNGKWKNEWYHNYSIDKLTPARENEVFEMLKNEAIKKGLVHGVIVQSALYDNWQRRINGEYRYLNNNALIVDNITLFVDGNWAKVIEKPKQMTIEEIEDELGYKFSIKNN